MAKSLPAHRMKPNNRSRHDRKRKESSAAKDKDDEGSFVDDSPRELLAMGAVLDHLWRGGHLSESTRVFMREASRGRLRRGFDASSDAPGLLPSSLSCLSVCSNPQEVSFNAYHEYRDDYDVDDGYTIPTAAFRRFNDYTKEGEDFTMSFEDYTLDEATLETFDDDATIEMVDMDAVMRASKNMWKDLDPHEKLRIDSAFLEKYVDEDYVDEEILGAIAMNVAQVEENIFDLVSDPHEVLSAETLFGFSFDQEDDAESVNSLAKKMHGMLQRKSSRLFATSDTKGDGQKAVIVRRRLPRLPHKIVSRRPAITFSPHLEDDDDDLTFEVRRFDKEKDEQSVGPSMNINSDSLLAKAPSMLWPPTFPSTRNSQNDIFKSESPLGVFAGLDFISHENIAPGSTTATLSSSTAASRTVLRGNGNVGRTESSKGRFFRSPTVLSGPSIPRSEDDYNSTTISSLSSPRPTDRIISIQPLPSTRSEIGLPPVDPRRRNLLRRFKSGSRRRTDRSIAQGILAPLHRNETFDRGFEVQQVEQRRFEI